MGGAVPSPYYIGCRVEALYDDGVWYDGVLDAGPEVRDGEKKTLYLYSVPNCK